MKRYAFTMLELVMVIVVLGIIAAVALPRIDRDISQEAADNVLSSIRYTQHLALMDNKTNPSERKWQKTLWHIRFATYTSGGNTKWFYTVGANMDKGNNIDKTETAIDPTNGKYMYNANGDATIHADESPNIFIGDKFGIDSVVFAGGCAGNQHIAFDHLGRVYSGIYSASNNFATYMSSDCTITFDFIDPSYTAFTINIEAETGYAYINGQNNS